jgi:hypothetical protein
MTTIMQDAPAAKAEKAQESSHWYEHTNGGWSPLYTPEKSFTLREARKAQKEGRKVVPSVTTYFRVLHKQNLVDWKVENAVKLAYEKSCTAIKFGRDEWVDGIISEASHSSRGAMNLGTDIHTAIEQAIAGQDYNADMRVYVEPAIACRKTEGLVSLSVEECVGSLADGYAGRCDEFFQGMIVGDNKSRKTTPKKKVATYDTEALQLAAYGFAKWGLDFFSHPEQERGGVIFVISTSEPGRVEPVWFTRKELGEAFYGFGHLTGVWRYMNSFDPRTP